MSKETPCKWTNQISGEAVFEILNSSSRGEFVVGYEHFEDEGNQEVVHRWILANRLSTKNAILEDLFTLAREIRLVRTEINDLCLKVLSGRHPYLTKLACLDYLLHINQLLDPKFIKMANTLAFQRTRNPIVRFQATLNLCLSDFGKYYPGVNKQLIASQYPTLFYRLANQLWLLPESSRKPLAEIIQPALLEKGFSDEVERELLDRIGELSIFTSG